MLGLRFAHHPPFELLMSFLLLSNSSIADGSIFGSLSFLSFSLVDCVPDWLVKLGRSLHPRNEVSNSSSCYGKTTNSVGSYPRLNRAVRRQKPCAELSTSLKRLIEHT